MYGSRIAFVMPKRRSRANRAYSPSPPQRLRACRLSLLEKGKDRVTAARATLCDSTTGESWSVSICACMHDATKAANWARC